MKKILVIGSAVADVIINLEDRLPRTGDDVHVRSQEMRMGGCAYNTYDIIRLFEVPSIPFFPIGQGAYGDFIYGEFQKKGIASPIPRPANDNGCCYCFIEPDGERTFISYHGAEYRFYREWFSIPDPDAIHSIYFCGLEIEETTGPAIVEFIEHHPEIPAYFAPGPRISRIDPVLMERIFACSPILHLNREESMQFTGEPTVEEAAAALYLKTHNTVLITLGADGCAWYDPSLSRLDSSFDSSMSAFHIVPGFHADQVDTVGAGDAHIGAILAARYLGYALPDAIRIANQVSARVVCVRGANLSEQEFSVLKAALI